MPSSIILRQLDAIKTSLSHNVESIKSLIATSDSLGKVIDTLSKKDTDPDTIEALEKTRSEISKAIDDLLLHTDNLFEAYKEMARDL